MSERVQGHCPSCGGTTLFLGTGGYVTCSLIDCPRPDAASVLLDDAETEHVVKLDADGFTVRHPLRERLDDELMSCQLHRDIAAMDGPPRQLGRYRVIRIEGRWSWFRLATERQANADV